MAEKDLTPFNISGKPAVQKLREQIKNLSTVKKYTKGSDKKQVDALIAVLNQSIKMIATNCPNGMTTSVVVPKAALKKIKNLG